MTTLAPSPLNGVPGRTSVAIIGLDALTRTDAPWNDASWDIWGLNGAHQCQDIHRDYIGRFRADRWFQIHPMQTWSPDEREWFEFAERLSVRTVVRRQEFDVSPALEKERFLQPYPIDDVLKAFPGAALVNSFGLIIPPALLEGYERIGLFGVELRAVGRELLIERPALFHWLGYAAGQGVQIIVPPRSTLMPCPRVYGLDYFAEAGWVAEASEQLLPARWIRALRHGGNLDTVQQVADAKAEMPTT